MITNQEYLYSIRKCYLFDGIKDEQLTEAIKLLNGRIRKVEKDDFIVQLGGVLRNAGLLLKGKIESSFQNENYDLARKNLILNQKVRILSQKSLRDRILIYLGTLPKDKNSFVKIPFTQTALAEYLGVNRSALSRELGRMQNEGLLIVDKEKMKRIKKKQNKGT